MLAIKVSAEGEIIVTDDMPNEGSSLEFLQGCVGGLIEAVDFDNVLTMWVNEEGLFNGASENPIATLMWEAQYGDGKGVIMGDVVFTGGTDEEGKVLGLTQREVDMFMPCLAKAKIVAILERAVGLK